MSDRRTFLRGLASLPLIGGGIALIGSPTRAAVPVTPALRERYISWLGNELAAVHYETEALACDPVTRSDADWRSVRVRMPFYRFPDCPDIARATAWTNASSRAPVILSAAGVPLT